jgi:hypothetical protein
MNADLAFIHERPDSPPVVHFGIVPSILSPSILLQTLQQTENGDRHLETEEQTRKISVQEESESNNPTPK